MVILGNCNFRGVNNMPRNKISLSDLSKHTDKISLSEGVDLAARKPKAKKKVKSQSVTHTPLQVLKLDEFVLSKINQNDIYVAIRKLQDFLVDMLDTKDLKDRQKEIRTVLNEYDKGTLKDILYTIDKKTYPGIKSYDLAIREGLSKLDDFKIRILLEKTVSADDENKLGNLYYQLSQKIYLLAGNVQDNQGSQRKAIIDVNFQDYIRVGGLSGFRERIFPVMHPVYGIPYVPASSIKGVIRAWARKVGKSDEDINCLLGYISSESSSIARVQFLDAFPIHPSLQVDISTPQWKWNDQNVTYGPSPHIMLSLKDLHLRIGLCATSRGKDAQVEEVLKWLQQAIISEGVGSRTSAGYGRVSEISLYGVEQPIEEAQQPSYVSPILLDGSERSVKEAQPRSYKFEFWSQGMYGFNPPSKDNEYNGSTEFRSTSVRGILRYWFRAIALDLFSIGHCQTLESLLFGTLEPKAQQGHIQIALSGLNDIKGDKETPHHASGEIILKCRTQKEIIFLESLLKLATHLGGVGRGSRRPLHINMDGTREDLRGCNWQITDPKMQVSYDEDGKEWKEFVEMVRNQLKDVKEEAFQSLKPEELSQLNHAHTMGTGSPGEAGKGKRLQDVINLKTYIYLVKTPKIKLPPEKGWNTVGNRGAGLSLFYGSGYKGLNRNGDGNIRVGGALEVPSFVWIATNSSSDPENIYQVITIFGTDQADRKKFAAAVKDSGALLVWPKNPTKVIPTPNPKPAKPVRKNTPKSEPRQAIL